MTVKELIKVLLDTPMSAIVTIETISDPNATYSSTENFDISWCDNRVFIYDNARKGVKS